MFLLGREGDVGGLELELMELVCVCVGTDAVDVVGTDAVDVGRRMP